MPLKGARIYSDSEAEPITAGESRQQELEAAFPTAHINRKRRAMDECSAHGMAPPIVDMTSHFNSVIRTVPTGVCKGSFPSRLWILSGQWLILTSTVIISKLKLKELYMWLTFYH